jgi:hypothetical protein
MADNEAYYGFRPYMGNHKGGGTCHPKTVRCTVATAYQAQDDGSGFSVDLNIGDPVKLVSTGTIALANTTESVFGIVAGFEYYWDGDVMRPTNKLPGGNAWGTVEERRPWVHVIPANACLWEVDVDDSTTATTFAAYQAFVFENVEHTCVGVSADATATPKLDISGHATTAGLGWRIEGVSQTKSNRDFSGANVKLIVSCNTSQDSGQAATTIAGV